MKRKLYFRAAVCLVASVCMPVYQCLAQAPCPPNGISTNPANPSPANPPAGKEYKKNTFDWKAEFLNAANSNYYIANSPLTNFYNYEVNNPNFQHIAKGTASDYYTEEGWELIKQDFGRLANGTLNPVRSEGPYYVLYNRYSGILRIIAAFPGLGAQQAINVKISFKPKDPNNANQNQLGVSALFNTYGKVARAMDQPTLVNNVVTPAVFSGSDRRFFYADFQTAYDPCTCLFESALIVEFSTINQFTAQLSGRLLGVSEPIALYQNGTYKLDKNQDYLTSIYQNDAATNNAQAGMLMYTTIPKMIADYKANAASPQVKQTAFDFFLGAFNDFLTVGKALTTITTGDKFPAGLDAVGSLVNFFSGKLKSPNSPTPPPQPSVIHAEMALTGTITDQRVLASSYFNFATPGSKKSNDKPEYNDGVNVSPPDVDYPVYNETLGTFALLETPKIQESNTTADLYVPLCWDDGGPAGGYVSHTFQLGRDLKYVYNPKANINDNLSRISAAWVFDVGPNGGPGCAYEPEGINAKLIYTRDAGNFNVYYTLITPFLELNYFKNFAAGVYLTSDISIQHIYLRLKLETISDDLDRAGNNNQTISIVTYELPLNTYTNEIPKNLTPFYEMDQTYSHPIQYTSSNNWTENYWGTVYINTALSTTPGVTKTFNANDFVIGPNGSVSSGIILNRTKYISPATHSKAQSQAAVTDFCSNAALYRANSNLTARRAGAIAPLAIEVRKENTVSEDVFLNVYPSPAASDISIQYHLAQPAKVSLFITDALGHRVVTVGSNVPKEKGEQKQSVSVAGLPNGTYFLVVESEAFKTSKKFVIAK